MFQNRHSTLTGEIVYYYSGDPAFDKESRHTDVPKPEDAADDWQPPLIFDYRRWVETRDEKYIPRKPGKAACKIVCRRLKPEEWAYIEDVGDSRGQNQAFMALVRMSVQRIEPRPPDTPEVEHEIIDRHKMLCEWWTTALRSHDKGGLYFELTTLLYQEMHPSARS